MYTCVCHVLCKIFYYESNDLRSFSALEGIIWIIIVRTMKTDCNRLISPQKFINFVNATVQIHFACSSSYALLAYTRILSLSLFISILDYLALCRCFCLACCFSNHLGSSLRSPSFRTLVARMIIASGGLLLFRETMSTRQSVGWQGLPRFDGSRGKRRGFFLPDAMQLFLSSIVRRRPLRIDRT